MIDESRLRQYPLLLQTAFLTGFVLGGYGPARKAALQFHAEHQHNPPLNRPEAVVYFRRRNYRVLAALGREGARRGVQVAADAVLAVAVPGRRGRGEEVGKGAVSGAAAGALFGLAGRGHRLYYTRRGALFGGLLGAGLGVIREVAYRFG